MPQDPTFVQMLLVYWSSSELQTNGVIFLNLAGALLLGCMVGYERSYHGRAAGMRTYGLVCMASAGLTVVTGYPGLWFGGQHVLSGVPDPTRVIQGIVTGIGFLGAGVIVKDGLNISGLTTAASIWASSSIGVLIGVGFYASAILLALLSAGTMMWGSRIENWLPSHPAIAVHLRLHGDATWSQPEWTAWFAVEGYTVAPGSFSIDRSAERCVVRFVIVAKDRKTAVPMDQLSARLSLHGAVSSVSLAHARN